MKLIPIIFTLLVLCLHQNAGAQDVPLSVSNSFAASFPYASKTEWMIAGQLYRAGFKTDGQHHYAFYDAAGELVAESRYIRFSQLTIRRQYELIKDFPEYNITEIFEVINADEKSWFATLERNGISLLVTSRSGPRWKLFEK